MSSLILYCEGKTGNNDRLNFALVELHHFVLLVRECPIISHTPKR